MLCLLGQEFEDDENDTRTFRAFLRTLPQRRTVRHGVAPRKQARVFKASIRTGLQVICHGGVQSEKALRTRVRQNN
jgi:hypothetical protein